MEKLLELNPRKLVIFGSRGLTGLEQPLPYPFRKPESLFYE